MTLTALERELETPDVKYWLAKLAKLEDKIAEALNPDNIISYIQNVSEKQFYSEMYGRSSKLILESAASIDAANWLKSNVDATVAKGSEGALSTVKSKGIVGVIKNLFRAITENGSPIGILHLVLDLVGIFGDAVFATTGLPIGAIADILNAMIYFYRGKNMLGVISIIAALIPFGGDVLKGFKGVASNFSKSFSKVTTKGSGELIAKDAAETLVKLNPEQFAKSNRFIQYLKKVGGKILSPLVSAIGFISNNIIAKVAGYIPFIGKPLKNFFSGLGKKAATIGENMASFSKHAGKAIDDVLKTEVKSMYKSMNKVMKKGTGEIVQEGGMIVIKDGGKVVKSMEISKFAKFSNHAAKFPKGTNLHKVYGKGADDIAKFYSKLAKEGHEASKFLAKHGMVKGVKGKIHWSKLWAHTAKALVLLMPGGHNMEDFEKEAMSNIITKADIEKNRRRLVDKLKKKHNADYYAPIADPTSKDQDEKDLAFWMMCDLADNARMTGLPDADCQKTWNAYQYSMLKDQENEKNAADFYASSLSQEEISTINNQESFSDMKLESVQFKHIVPFKRF